MAAPAYVSSGTGAVSGSTPIAVPYPASISVNDLLLMHFTSSSASETLTTPSGWTLISGGNTLAFKGTSWVLGKVASGSETGNLSVTWGAVGKGAVQMHKFSNGTLSYTTPVTSSSLTTVVTDVDVTTTVADCLALNFVHTPRISANIPVFTGMSGGTWVERAEFDDGGFIPDSNSIQLQTAAMPSPATISGGTCTAGDSAWINVGFALTPSSAPAASKSLGLLGIG